jgi:hypothetical protein
MEGRRRERGEYLVLFFFCISFFRAAPSNGLSNSNAQSRSSETLITAPKLSNSTTHARCIFRLICNHLLLFLSVWMR